MSRASSGSLMPIWPSRFRRHVKRLVYERDRGRCLACGSDELIQYDHVVPWSMGGGNEPQNIRLLCAGCNRRQAIGGRIDLTQPLRPLRRLAAADNESLRHVGGVVSADLEFDCTKGQVPWIKASIRASRRRRPTARRSGAIASCSACRSFSAPLPRPSSCSAWERPISRPPASGSTRLRPRRRRSAPDTSAALAEPPAAAEQGILSELLTTRAFAASVAETSLLGKSLGSADAIRENATRLLGNGQVVQTVPGGQILQISYSASSPAMAESVLGAVIAQLRNYTDRLTAQHDQAAVAYDREQVKAAADSTGDCAQQRHRLSGTAPGGHPNRPELRVSCRGREQCRDAARAGQYRAEPGDRTSNADGWSIQVIDPPSPASTTTLRKSKMAEVILGGALGGLLVSFLAVVALTPAKKEVWEDELPIGRAARSGRAAC